MKKVTNVVLALCALGLLYMCYASIMGPIEFDKQKNKRDKAVIARLIEIRDAQVEYRRQFDHYTNSFDTLIDFIKNGSVKTVFKVGELTDLQKEDGLTEAKAMRIINKAKKTNKWKEVEKYGLEDFKRDTISTPIIGENSLFPANFKADSIKYIPFSNGTKVFELEAKIDTLQSGPAKFFEARTLYKDYLEGLDKQEIINITQLRKELDKYPGLKIGSMEEPLVSGNWESL